ncbi:MAG: hypothetical protein R3Y32_08145, partial [Bacillota bacterium]
FDAISSDENTTVGSVTVDGNTFDVTFTPTNTNYTTVEATVTITVAQVTPTADVPTGLTATYGDLLSTVILTNPADNTAGTWAFGDTDTTYDATTTVGDVTTNGNSFDVTFTPSDDTNYTIVETTVTITVAQKASTAVAPTGLTATYEDLLSSVTLTNTTDNTAGTWAFGDTDTTYDATTTVGDVTTSGNTFDVTFTPSDATNYTTVETTVSIAVAQKASTAVVPTGLAATYGDLLSSVTLTNAVDNTAGTWTFGDSDTTYDATTVGSVTVDGNTFDVTFTPTNTNYTTVEATVTITVAQVTPTADVPTGLTATYGDLLSTVILTNPADNTAGTWAFGDTDTTYDTTTVGDYGTNTFDVTFTPSDATNYTTVETTVTITVAQKASTAVAPTGLTATYGDLLSIVTLANADDNTDGTWAYSVSDYDANTTTVGDYGTNTFDVTFTPSDDTNYTTVEATVDIDVAPEGVDADDYSETLGALNTAFDGLDTDTLGDTVEAALTEMVEKAIASGDVQDIEETTALIKSAAVGTSSAVVGDDGSTTNVGTATFGEGEDASVVYIYSDTADEAFFVSEGFLSSSNATIESAMDACESIELSAYKVTEVGYTIKVDNDGAETTISIPYAGSASKTYYIAHVSNGVVEFYEGTYADGSLTFATEYFSEFVVLEIPDSSSSSNITIGSSYTVGGSSSSSSGSSDVEVEEEVETPEATVAPSATEAPTATETPTATTAPLADEASNSSNAWIWIVLGVLAIGAIAGFVIYKKKKQ